MLFRFQWAPINCCFVELNNTRWCAEFTYGYWKTCISWDFFFLYRKMMRKVDFQDFFKTCICRYVRDLSTDFPFMQKIYCSDNLPFYCKRHKNWILPDKCAGLGSHTCILYFTQCTKLLKRLRILCSKKLLYKLCNQQHKLHVFIMHMYVILFWHTYKFLHTIRFYKKKVSKF